MSRKSVLSFTASGHGFSGALMIDGLIVAANTLERLTRKKYDILLPISKIDLKTLGWNADPQIYEEFIDLPFDLKNDYSVVDFNELEDFILLQDYILKIGGVELKDIDTVVYSYRHNESIKKYFKEKKSDIEFIVPEHHFIHACQAYLPSPFDEAAIMIIDGQGVPLVRTDNDPLSGCLAYGKGNNIKVLYELPVKYSLGGMYSQITKLCGFKTNEEGKTMGLAPYGGPEYYNILRKKLKFETKEYNFRDLKGLFKHTFHPKEYIYSLGRYYSFLKKIKPRGYKEEFTDIYKNFAYAGQKMIEDVMIYLAEWLYQRTKSKNLCIAGGVALNCVANYKIFANSKFENIFIYPNAGDNGLAVGQALFVNNFIDKNNREYLVVDDYLGKQYSRREIKKAIDKYKKKECIKVQQFKDLNRLYEAMAVSIEKGQITSWWQGRSEFGPRALGNRSILADPRRSDMKDILNSRVKFRESFRPFTPSVLKERAADFFTIDIESPFMLLAPYVKTGKRKEIPAVTHVDNTARVQTVKKDENERYYNLIKAFEKRTGIPMVLNTSFNIAGEPIVETPEDAIKCFFSTGIDVLCIDDFLLIKVNKE